MQALQQGEASGCWCLGSRTAHVGGVLVWLRRERHVVELVAKGGWETLGEIFRESSQAAPWLRYVVGAPKKGAAKAKSRRGQHLTREGRAARAQRELEAPASATEPVEGRAEAAAVSSERLEWFESCDRGSGLSPVLGSRSARRGNNGTTH